jgi:glycosidase
LLDNDRRRIELMNGMLMSLPGTPIIYYGDEIGMGDNIYLGDRNGVRTPMQWSGGWQWRLFRRRSRKPLFATRSSIPSMATRRSMSYRKSGLNIRCSHG